MCVGTFVLPENILNCINKVLNLHKYRRIIRTQLGFRCEEVVFIQISSVLTNVNVVVFQVEQSKVLIKEGGVQLTLTIVDTPGFGDAVDNSNW